MKINRCIEENTVQAERQVEEKTKTYRGAEGAFRVSLRIVAADTTGMANHITEVISRDLKLNIRSINFASLANGCIAGTVSVEVPGAGVVDTLIHSIMRIKGVQRAFRINN